MSASPRRPPSVPNLRGASNGQMMSGSPSRDPGPDPNYYPSNPQQNQQQYQQAPANFRPPSVASSSRPGPPRPTIDTSYANGQPSQHQQQHYNTAPVQPNYQDPYYANGASRDSTYPSISSRKSQMTLPASAIDPREEEKARRVSAAQGPLLDQCKLNDLLSLDQS